MFTTAILADVPNSSLIFGFMPESLSLLVFGFVLIAIAVLLRRLFERRKDENDREEYSKKMR